MSLKNAIEDLLKNPPLQQGYICKIAKILGDLSPEDAKALSNLLDNQEISSAAIARLLTQHNYDVKSASIGKHRKRGQGNGCRCKK